MSTFMDMHLAKHVGMAAAFKGANILRSYYGKLSSINKKGRTDLVTEADTESERAIIETIRNAFPHHSILAEESGLNQGTKDHQWVIDPLDGTTNFAHRFPFFAVSIGLRVEKEMVLGIVYNPCSEDFYIALKGQGTYHNN